MPRFGELQIYIVLYELPTLHVLACLLTCDLFNVCLLVQVEWFVPGLKLLIPVSQMRLLE